MLRVLVVEDNLDNLTLMCDILDSLGITALIAHNGSEGLDKARSEKPDLILMDLSMPVMDGWTATRMIKADPDLAAVPVIALTAHAMAGDRDRALEAGADDYITKPIVLRDFVVKLQTYLRSPE
jgi:two-component system, cell cycle response regulator DivK